MTNRTCKEHGKNKANSGRSPQFEGCRGRPTRGIGSPSPPGGLTRATDRRDGGLTGRGTAC